MIKLRVVSLQVSLDALNQVASRLTVHLKSGRIKNFQENRVQLREHFLFLNRFYKSWKPNKLSQSVDLRFDGGKVNSSYS